MRMIGHLPDEVSAATFSDFLSVRGISNLVETEKEGWAVWIHSEDELVKAGKLLAGFLANPTDPQYQPHTWRGREQRRGEGQAEGAAADKVFDRKKLFRATLPFGMGWVTFLLILASVTLWGFAWLNDDRRWLDAFFITKYRLEGNYLKWVGGFPEITHGEIWRLFTPILIHDWHGPAHLLFNMYALLIFGNMIEARQSTWRLASLVLVIAGLSNLAQYYMSGPMFCGMSGVVYGLLGYIWMRGKFDPASGLFLHRETVAVMLVWFVFCMTPLMDMVFNMKVANTVHAVGLLVGVAWGYLSSPRALRNRSR